MFLLESSQSQRNHMMRTALRGDCKPAFSMCCEEACPRFVQYTGGPVAEIERRRRRV